MVERIHKDWTEEYTYEKCIKCGDSATSLRITFESYAQENMYGRIFVALCPECRDSLIDMVGEQTHD